MPERGPRSVSDSKVTLTQMMEVTDANVAGNVHGGVIMRLVDTAAALAAIKHAGGLRLTVALDEMTFLEPVHIGEVIVTQACVNDVGTTSMECGVRVEAEDPLTGIVRHVNSAYLVFVAIDEEGRPSTRAAAARRDRSRTAAAARGQAPPGAPAWSTRRPSRPREPRRPRRRAAKRVLSVRAGVSRVRGRMDVRSRGRTRRHDDLRTRRRPQPARDRGRRRRHLPLPWLAERASATSRRLPHTVKILLENLLRRAGTPRRGGRRRASAGAQWPQPAADIAFMPGRVLMQDFTGVPAVVDLAAMRERRGARRAGSRDRSTRWCRWT